jgi:hypothetical protein
MISNHNRNNKDSYVTSPKETIGKELQESPALINKTNENKGIYRLTCKTCKQAYVGQTSRNLKQCYQEHM